MIELSEKMMCPDCLQELRVFAVKIDDSRFIILIELCKHKLELLNKLEQFQKGELIKRKSEAE